jgi:hypothetical protein
VHALEDAEPGNPQLAEAVQLMLIAETSCYWYWTGQHVWDQQVTNAANKGYAALKGAIDGLVSGRKDRTGPTIFAPWVTPENPGGKRWGQGCLLEAPREGTVHTFVSDIAGLKRVELVVRAGGKESRIPMQDRGPYPSQTGAAIVANYLTAALPAGAGDVRYFIEAEDGAGNIARSALERIFCA